MEEHEIGSAACEHCAGLSGVAHVGGRSKRSENRVVLQKLMDAGAFEAVEQEEARGHASFPIKWVDKRKVAF